MLRKAFPIHPAAYCSQSGSPEGLDPNSLRLGGGVMT